MKSSFLYILILLITTSFSNQILCQYNNLQQNFNSNKKVKVQSVILSEIETSIQDNDIQTLSKYFTSQPYISLINGVNGYYSSNQAYYILEDFFKTYKVVSFSFDEKKAEESVSYGRGAYYYEKKGKRETAHLYITLNKAGSKWYITQISIN